MSPRLQIRLLGGLELSLDGAPVVLRYDKLRGLLAYLAVERDRAHPREALAGLLWPESPEADARRNLSQALFNLRQALGEGSTVPAPAVPLLLATRQAIQFNPASDHTLDVADFEGHLQDCAVHAHAAQDACPDCAERLQQAAGLYRGDFLQQFFVPDSAAFEEWSLLKREALRRQALNALARLVACFERRSDYARAIEYARRQLVLEPWREEAHRDLMRLLALDGQRSAALAQYEAARKALADELGVAPSPETDALLAQIKAGPLLAARAEAAPAPPRPPAATAGAPLPIPLTPFVGREHELAEIGRLLADPACRLLTLVGAGGIGKTRLAIQAAAQRDAFTHSTAWVPLAPVNTSEQVLTAVGDALGVTFQGSLDPTAQLMHYLRHKTALLVLDNFEHLLVEAAGPAWLAELLAGAPDVKLLVTSREALNLQGEWLFPVDGLGDEAIDLFVHSARRARADFELRPEEAPEVARICKLVGHTPLAVELAASWVRVLSCAEIAEEIERAFASDHRLDFLTTRARDVPERHRSLAAVFDHSWQLLSGEEQAALSRLAVFRGGFGRAAAEAVAGASLAALSALSAKSLLRRAGARRYDLHELVRQYALDRLAQAPGELAGARDAHCAYFARFMASRADAMRSSRQLETAAEVAAELDNIHAAWQWAVEQARPDTLRQLALTVYLFSQRRGRYREGVAMLAQAIAAVEADPAFEAQEAVAGFLLGRGWLLIRLGQLDSAESDFLRAQTLYDQLGRQPVDQMIGDPHMGRGIIASIRGDYAAATELYQATLGFLEARNDPQALAYPHLYLASVQRAQGDYAAAERYAQQGHTLAKAAGQPWVIGFALNELGQVAYARGDFAEAQRRFEASYVVRENLNDPSGMALDLAFLGQVALARGELAEARRLFERSLAAYHDTGDQGGLTTVLHGLGRTAAAEGRYPEGWAHLTQALEVAQRASFVPVTLALLVSLAEVLLETGTHDRARRLLAVVLAQPILEHETRARAERLLERLGATPPAERPAASGASLAETVAAALAEPL